MYQQNNSSKITLMLCLPALLFSQSGFTQGEVEEVVVTGIRGSLQSAIIEKRDADNLIEVIRAEDIGKLPDQNLAEVLENITGIQITREAGVGTAVQIRGTDENRIEINGVSTVGSGTGRGGISFEDIDASMISSVEVVKVPEAKTIEGSVGGTINLRTIRPLELTEQVGSLRVQGENSNLSTDSTFQPRLSGTYGNNWLTNVGDFGVVISGSYTKQDVTAFEPRVDRDNLVKSDSGYDSAENFNYLPIQFLNQVYINQEYETKNFSGAFEFAPNDNLKLYFDTVINDQERRQESARAQLSGVSNVRQTADIKSFETVNLGSLDGKNGNQNLGSIQAATSGYLSPLSGGNLDPNLRGSSDTGSRITDSKIFRLGTEFEYDRFSGAVEASRSESDTVSPDFSTTINFINPNSPNTDTSTDPDVRDRNDNGLPVEFDLRGGDFTFGIRQGQPTSPTTAMLLDPANYQLHAVNQGQNIQENKEDALRLDFSYDFTDLFQVVESVDVGYRFNKNTSLRNEVGANNNFRGFGTPTGNLFASVLTPGPNNFDDADDRALFIKDFLVVNQELAFSNPAQVRTALNEAITENNELTGRSDKLLGAPTSSLTSFFDIEEKTHAVYGQANFEYGIFRGNAGLRYLHTSIDSVGNTVLEVEGGEDRVERVVSSGSYNFLLPRVNLVANPVGDVILRFGYSKDINRPDFDQLSTSRTFETSVNAAVEQGNANLVPEEVQSFDFSAEWYFAPASVASVGVFYKERTDLFVDRTDAAPEIAPDTYSRDKSCPGGGFYNPIALPTIGQNSGIQGTCVDFSTQANAAGETTQFGIELAFQYSLAEWEAMLAERNLGWVSGFGLIANYTYQEEDGSETFNGVSSRANAVFKAQGLTEDATYRATLSNLSEHAYNITLFYEKYGISARARYTWRDAFRIDRGDFPGTSGIGPFNVPPVQEDRGQLNASIIYAVNDMISIGVEGINLTEEDAPISCINADALLCAQGITDRRILVGGTLSF